MKEKTDPFMNPYWQKFEKIIGKQITDILETTGIINIVVPAFLRGMEFENKVVLYDESQNSSCTAMKTFLTRLGRDSKMIITGDPKQSDKDDISGLEDAMARLSKIKDITTANFTREDIVRHGLIREILDCYED
jgi:phosphate starvation-inducible protein PhoH and related proteins